MSNPTITAQLARLREAADNVSNAWPNMIWIKVSGPGPDRRTLTGFGSLSDLVFIPGEDLELKCELNLPSHVAGIPLDGDALEATIFSLYPTELGWNGKPVFADVGIPVAAGPALVTVVPQIQVGNNGFLDLAIRIPHYQTNPWFNLRFSTSRLRARFELLDTAWAELSLANALATSEAEVIAVQEAAALIPGDLSSFSEGLLEQIESRLSLLASKSAQINVHVIGHSHIDMNWMWTWPDTVNVIRRDFKNVLQLMDDYPELTFTHSQPATYEVIRQNDPDLFNRVVKHIQSGRWEPATLTWVEADSNLASGEALARHLTESVWYSKEHFGVHPSTFLAPDTFGHAGNLPQPAVSAGAARYYHHRCNPGQADLWPAYWWEGQDGTPLLAISTPTYNGEIRARDLVEAALRAWKHGQMQSIHFHGIGDHGGGPSRQNLEALRRFQNRPLLPSSHCSTLANYTTALLNSSVKLPVWRGESATVFEGCYTTHADIKYYNRQGENILCTADTLAALAGQVDSSPLQNAWRAVLFNQFHDILDGSAIHETYEKSAADFAEVQDAAKTVIGDALRILESGKKPGTIAVTNPLGWDREDWVMVDGVQGAGTALLLNENGQASFGQYSAQGLGFVARIPAFETVAFQVISASAEPEGLSITPAYAPTDSRQVVFLAVQSEEPPYYKIETPVFRIYVRRDSGIFVSFFDKRANLELVGFGMRRGSDYMDSARADLALNVLQLAEEYSHGMSAWHYDEVHTEFSLLRGGTTRILEAGSSRIILETKHHLRDSLITQHMIFYRDLARVDFETFLDWKELGSPQKGTPNLKIAFTARLPECDAWFETPFAAVHRPADGQEVPALRWADIGGQEYGIALLNDCKYGYDALGCRLRLTLVRSGYEPDTHSDIGEHTIRYSLVPHPGAWQQAGIVQAAAGFNQPLMARLVKESLENTKPVWKPGLHGSQSVLISCLKASHAEAGRVIRLYESTGQVAQVELTGLPQGADIWETTIVEERLRPLQSMNGRLSLTFSPWQVRTILVKD